MQRLMHPRTLPSLMSAPAILRALASIALILVAGLAVTLSATPKARAMCVPFPCADCWVVSAGQLNLVVLDRQNDKVSLIPNILVQGEAPAFALIVPTPSVPELSEVTSGDLWSSLSAMTARVGRRSVNDDFGCGESDFIAASVDSPGSEDDAAESVEVILEVPVGAFDATVVSSDDADALVEWLRENGFDVAGLSSSTLAPLVADGWVFTAMKLREGIDMPQGGWNTNVQPIRFDYDAEQFEIPFGLLSVNRGARQPMVFYVVDDHRMELPSFQVTYANRISGSEYAGIERTYPSVAPYVAAGRFVTRMERTFFSSSEVMGRTTLRQAESDSEFRATWRSFSSVAWGLPGWLLALIGSLQLMRWVARRRVA